MQSTPLASALATLAGVPPQVAPTSLAAAFAAVPDPRPAARVTYPLPALLALAVAALLANHRSVLAIAEWAARQERALLATRGFPAGRTPCQSTLHRLFRRLDGDALAAALTAHWAPLATPPPPPETAEAAESPALPAAAAPPPHPVQGVAIDGKAQRGRLRFAGGGCPVHALSAFAHDQGVVLAHEPIARGIDKAEAELSVAPALLDRLDWHGRAMTGDALFRQRPLCRRVRRRGGDYLLLVKANQPTLYQDIALLFDPPPDVAALPLADRREAQTVERGHGRTDERRHLIASTDLTAYLDWPDLAQVFRLERTRREGGRTHRALHYGITSLGPDRADPARLLELRRGHWATENRLNRQKDVAFGEDASLIHRDQGPTVLALLRDAALSVLHHAGVRRVAARLRALGQHPDQAIALVVNPPPAHA